MGWSATECTRTPKVFVDNGYQHIANYVLVPISVQGDVRKTERSLFGTTGRSEIRTFAFRYNGTFGKPDVRFSEQWDVRKTGRTFFRTMGRSGIKGIHNLHYDMLTERTSFV